MQTSSDNGLPLGDATKRIAQRLFVIVENRLQLLIRPPFIANSIANVNNWLVGMKLAGFRKIVKRGARQVLNISIPVDAR